MRTYRNISMLVIIALLAVSCGGVKVNTDWNTKTQLLQLLINGRVSDTTVPGIIMSVKTPDGTWVGAAGKANTASDYPMLTGMRFRLASVTKTFTAAIVMKLVEEGKLALTDTVEKWLPGLITVTGGSAITVKQLLNHTSGIHDYEDDIPFYTGMIDDPTHEWTQTEILALINGHALDFTPGSDFLYSNAGYYLLGLIIESAGEDTVERLASSKIFTPASMSYSSLSKQGTLTGSYTQGYGWLWTDRTVHDTTDWNLSWDWTAGSGISTGQDMLNFMDALFGGLIVNSGSLSQMLTVQSPAEDYGYGVVVYDYWAPTGEKTYTHAGNNPGTGTIYIYMPNSQRSIFIELNRSDMNLVNATDVPVDTNAVLQDIVMYAMDILNG